jgi:hypothetical protein
MAPPFLTSSLLVLEFQYTVYSNEIQGCHNRSCSFTGSFRAISFSFPVSDFSFYYLFMIHYSIYLFISCPLFNEGVGIAQPV